MVRAESVLIVAFGPDWYLRLGRSADRWGISEARESFGQVGGPPDPRRRREELDREDFVSPPRD